MATDRAHLRPFGRPLATAPIQCGRLLLDDADPAARARGRGMIKAAPGDLHALGMVTRARLCESCERGRILFLEQCAVSAAG